MNHKSLLLLVLVIAAIAAYPRATYSSDLSCADKNGRCALKWNFSKTPKSSYQIQFLNPVTGKWASLLTKEMAHIDESDVDGGSLYRVLGCDRMADNSKVDCTSSNTVWVPVFPSEDEIPEYVIGANDEYMVIDKNLDLGHQTEQYNVYIFVKMLDALPIDIATLPPMQFRKKEAMADGRLTLLESMQLAFFANYSEKQRLSRNRRPSGADAN